MTVIGWCSLCDDACSVVLFTEHHKRALIERIRKRKYNFGHFDHEMMPFCMPVYNDNTTCLLTKAQWDSVISEAYKDFPRGPRLLPLDVITKPPKNGILYEKEKFQEGEFNNG